MTVSGRPAARLVPAEPRTWRTYEEIRELFAGPADDEWEQDRPRFDESITDPWQRHR